MTLKRLLPLLFLHLLMQNCISQTIVSGNKKKIEKIPQKNSYGFVENKGQVHDQDNKPNNSVKYLLNTRGLNVQLKANSFSYDTYITNGVENTFKPENSRHKNNETFIDRDTKKDISFKFHRIDVTLEGSNPTPVIISENPSRNVLNFYTSTTGPHGVLDVHHYNKITYHDIYPGIDMVFDVNEQTSGKQVEYYFIVKPGANPDRIMLHYKGAMQTALKNNAIEITVAHGKMQEQIPASYILPGSPLEYNNSEKKKIDVRYKSYGNNIYGFVIPYYNKNQTLIIDPTPDLEWGTYYGQSLNDWGYAITKDNNGNLFIAGATNNASGIATAGSYQSIFGGAYADAILGKFNNNGALQWLTYFGGSSQDEAYGITSDGNNVIITGWTFSTNAIATPGSHQENKAGPVESPDVFIAKFNNNGIRQWSTYFGGNDEEFSVGAAADANGNIFITGYSVSQNGIATPGSQQPVYAGGNPAFGESGDGFIAKFNNTGVLEWGTYYGGGRGDRCYGIAIDRNGNVLVSGSSNSSDQIASPIGAYQNTLSGPVDGIIVKLSNDGIRQWGTYYGGNSGEEAFAIATDNNNNIIITGRSYSTEGIATPGTQQPVFGGNYTDAFVAKFNPDGTRQWGTYYGGNGTEMGNAVTTDQSGNIFITGSSHSTNNIVTPNAYQTSISGDVLEWTPIVAKFSPNGFLQWGTYYGNGPPGDPNLPFSNGEGEGIITDGNGNVFICGSTTFRNGVSTCGAQQPACGGYRDIFVAKFSETIFSSQPSVSITADTTGSFCQGLSVTFKAITLNTGANTNYQWKLNGLNIGTNSDVFVTNSLVNGDIVTCVITMLQTPCNPSGSITSNNIVVAVSPLVSPSVTISSSSTTICTGNMVVFTAAAVNAGNNPVYQWKINGSNTGTNSSDFTTSALANGDVVSCILTSSSNCITNPVAASNVLPITVNEIIVPLITLQVSSNDVCPGIPVTFNVITGPVTGTPLYQWKLNGNNIGSNNLSYSSTDFSDGDLINFILTTKVPGCLDPVIVSSDTITMKIKNTPVIILLPTDTSIVFGTSLQLHASITGNVDHFTWNPPTGLSNPAILNPVASPPATITYQLYVKDLNGCESNEKITIRILTDIFIPNSFTPNNDGKNDIFRIPPGSSFTLAQFSIYDRWGNEIFKTKNINEGWNGTNNGTNLPTGNYVYLIKGRTSKGDVLLKGSVVLIR